MGKVLGAIGPAETKFISKQKMCFVGTAPLSAQGHVNISPKSPGTSVVVLDEHTVAYADLTGSGAETAAHILENQRMTIMFVNLEKGPPKILRLFGTGQVIIKENIDPDLLQKFPTEITSSYGFRCIYLLKVERISSSCGYSMPIMSFEKYRQTLHEVTNKEGPEGMKKYGILKNSFSIDGLPSIGKLRYEHNMNGQQDMIIPSSEEGYIYGKLVDKSDGNHNNRSDPYRHNIAALHSTISGKKWDWVSFSCGIFLGISIAGLLFVNFTSEIEAMLGKINISTENDL